MAHTIGAGAARSIGEGGPAAAPQTPAGSPRHANQPNTYIIKYWKRVIRGPIRMAGSPPRTVAAPTVAADALRDQTSSHAAPAEPAAAGPQSGALARCVDELRAAAGRLNAIRDTISERRRGLWRAYGEPPLELRCFIENGERRVYGPGDVPEAEAIWRGDVLRREEIEASFQVTRAQMGAAALYNLRLSLLADLQRRLAGAPDDQAIAELEIEEAALLQQCERLYRAAVATPGATVDDLAVKVQLWRGAPTDPHADEPLAARR